MRWYNWLGLQDFSDFVRLVINKNAKLVFIRHI